MATWSELARENRKAAKLLMTEDTYRCSVGRAYYAAYSAVTAKLMELPDIVRTFPPDRGNPTHRRLRGLVDQLPRVGLNSGDVSGVKRCLARLHSGRVEAEYVPGRTIGRQDAIDRYRDCVSVLDQLGIGA